MPPLPSTILGGGGAKICLCSPPHFQTQNLDLGIEPTDICDVTLARLALRCWARQMCPPPILSRVEHGSLRLVTSACIYACGHVLELKINLTLLVEKLGPTPTWTLYWTG